MITGFTPDPWYQPERDGPLEEFLALHDGVDSMPLFRGYAQFKMLWDKGYFLPGVSAIRLMWNIAREDEHFLVLGEYGLEGLHELRAHAGRKGIFDPRELLETNCPPWEAQDLNPDKLFHIPK